MSDRSTIEVYNQRAGEYADVTASDGPDATLATYIAALPQGARVLDLGCGPGASAGYMAQAGLRPEAWDASEQMVELARARPGVTARVASFDDLAELESDAWDGVWANFSLLHASREDMPRHLAQISRALRPGGLFHIGVKEGEGDFRDPLGRYYTYYTEESLSALLMAAGLTPGPYKRGRDRGLDGAIAPWISVTAHG